MRIIFALLAVMGILSCANKKNIIDPKEEIFNYPIAVGNKWVYDQTTIVDSAGAQIRNYSSEYSFSIIDTLRYKSNLLFTARDTSSDFLLNSTYWCNIEPFLVGFDGEGNYLNYIDTSTRRIGNHFCFPLHPGIGQIWADSIEETTSMGVFIRMIPLFIYSITGRNNITTPSAVYNDCWTVKAFWADTSNGADTVYSDFYPGVGLVSLTDKYYNKGLDMHQTVTRQLKSCMLK